MAHKIPTVTMHRELNDSGNNYKTIKRYSYVVTLCEIDGHMVQAIRLDGYERKGDVSAKVRETYPDWNIKTINKLYDEDFEKGGDSW